MSEVRDAIDYSDTPQDDLASLGCVLREERERQGMTCQAFADSLHMGKEQLAALENGDRDNLPEPVFICGMLRRVAEKLGLDPAPLVQKFQSQLRETKGAPAKRVSRERMGATDAPQDQKDSAAIGRWIRSSCSTRSRGWPGRRATFWPGSWTWRALPSSAIRWVAMAP